MKRNLFYSFLFVSFVALTIGCTKELDNKNDGTRTDDTTNVEPVNPADSTDVQPVNPADSTDVEPVNPADSTDVQPSDAIDSIVSEIGELPGIFSIGDGKQVHFSRGNLQYRASTQLWRFAETQYDYAGYDNENMSATYDGWVDNFAWGTSGWAGSGASAYMPYSFGVETENYFVGGNYNVDLTGEYANADWGVYNAISNGGNQAGLWRTMTAAEWRYLLKERPNASNLRSIARVCGHYGVVILPDGWTGGSHPFAPESKYDVNNYDATQWNDLQSEGAVFLPATGYRTLKAVGVPERIGMYWSVNYSRVSTPPDYIYAVIFHTGIDDKNGAWSIFENGECQRFLGIAVRLVHDVNGEK